MMAGGNSIKKKRKKKEKLEEFFTKTSLILKTLYDELSDSNIINISHLSLKAHTTYYWVVRKVELMEKLGLVKTNKEGRLRFVTLTKKGRKVAHHIKEAAKELFRR